jgi:hypothetical protein
MPNEDDLRAVIERQIAGQENIIFNDMLTDKQVLDIRIKSSEVYAKNPNQMASMKIAGFDIILPKQIVQEGNILRQASKNEILGMYAKEKALREKLKAESPYEPITIQIAEPEPKQQKEKELPLPPPPPPM